MDSGGSPANCQNKCQNDKNRPFRRTLGKLSKNCPRKPQNCQKIVKILSQDNYFTILGQNMDQKRGGGRRPPPLFWERPKAATIFLSKYCLKIVPGVLFDNILTIFGPLGEYFLSTFRGPSKIVGFQYFDNFQTICPGPLRDGPKSIF